MLKRIFTLAFLTLFSLGAQASWEEASQVVDKATADMLDIVSNPEMKEPENFELLLDEIEAVIGPIVDFEYIGKSVMGKFYRRSTDEEVSRFADVFKTTLLRTYAKAIVGFEFEKFEVQPAIDKSPDPDKQIVTVAVTAKGGEQYSLVYYLVRKDSEWTLVNVLVDGINLRITFRNQFASMMEEHSKIATVIERWNEVMTKDLQASS